MGFFSNLTKKVGKFIVSVFRDVEPVIEEPIEVEEVEEEYRRKIVKMTGYKRTAQNRSGKWLLYSYTFEDNTTDRSYFLRDKINQYGNNRDITIHDDKFGYDDEYIPEGKTPTFFYPDSIEGEE